VAELRDWLAAGDLAGRLARELAGPTHPGEVLRVAADVDTDTGSGLVLALLDTIMADPGHPAGIAVEDVWPAGTLLGRGGGGPTW